MSYPPKANVDLIREELTSSEALTEWELLMEERDSFWLRFKLFPLQRIDEIKRQVEQAIEWLEQEEPTYLVTEAIGSLHHALGEVSKGRKE